VSQKQSRAKVHLTEPGFVTVRVATYQNFSLESSDRLPRLRARSLFPLVPTVPAFPALAPPVRLL